MHRAARCRNVPVTFTIDLRSVVTVSTQAQLRAVRDLPFCHVCGETFLPTDQTNHDHVPAQTCFDRSDRNPPLKLKTHFRCNNEHTGNDEKLGDLIAVKRHRALNPANTRLRVNLLTAADGSPHAAYFDDLDVTGAIRRWVGGFHAALYREPLVPGMWFHVTPPLPQGSVEKDAIRIDPVPKQHLAFVEALKSNRALSRIDAVMTCSGRMRYECVWAEADRGDGLFCIFGLDIYGWIGLGDAKNFGARGCTGAYILSSRCAPAGASVATRLVVDFQNRSPFDPFGP